MSTDHVAEFVADVTYHGKSERTRDAYERVLREFEAFLGERGETPATADRRDCMAYIHSLRGDHADSTVATYASYLNRFYRYMTEIGAFDSNPMALVREEMSESVDTDPTRRDISLPEMRSFVADVAHPLDRALICTLLKTGIRVGELCNLDCRDLALSDEALVDAFDLGTRPQLSGRPDSLYVAADIRAGERVGGEVRTASNKRERTTTIPVDDELAAVLRRWLAIRPDGDSTALFTSTRDAWGERLTPDAVRSIVTDHAADRGWYRPGDGADGNVTPHYFRHFFTTHLRDRTGDRGIVKYLRGDVASDVIDTYTHDWGDRVRETYEANVYRLFPT
ncbi:integrase [Halobacteriales archaeon SW_7_68_16]|nr:MAG: integrase [Halobacteriales archaeon SW_7_68_16]